MRNILLTFFCLIYSFNLYLSTLIQEIDFKNFKDKIESSEEVWLLEIGSKMCGSCAEFFPEYESLAKEIKTVNFGMTNIDKSEGMSLVKNFKGVLDNGVPTVLMFEKINGKYITIVSGKVIKRNELKKIILNKLNGLDQYNGKYLKNKNKGEL